MVKGQTGTPNGYNSTQTKPRIGSHRHNRRGINGVDPNRSQKAQAAQRKQEKMAKDVAQKQIKAKKAELDMLKKQLQSMK